MVLICEKGIGKTHAKWSPVCTALYRLLPDIRFTQPIKGEDAKELVNLCPMGVFDIEDLGKGNQ
jgi:DNA-directed RNA polymerase I and III subunit RPAC1